MRPTSVETPQSESLSPLLLLVDDEPNVLSALRRALRGQGYQILTAEGGEQALAVMRQRAVDAIVCDMRMPGLSGAEVLRAARDLAPDAVRVLLTGYADLSMAIAAINDGEVFRYLSKPWDDLHLQQVLRDGLERRALERDRDALRELTSRQNEELSRLNADLERRVKERTRDLDAAVVELRGLHERLRAEFASTVRLLSSLVAARGGLGARCPQTVVRHVRLVGPPLGLLGEALNDTVFAALLLDIGKLALPDELSRQALELLAQPARTRVLGHPQVGESMLMGLPLLRGAGAVLGQVHENFDGSGVPGRLAGDAIAIGARLLRVAADFEYLQAGAITATPLTSAQAFRRLRQFRGTHYDPTVVDAFLTAYDQPVPAPTRRVLVASDSLRPGMRLAQDLVSSKGVLLLGADRELDAAMIAHIRRIENFTDDFLWISVVDKPSPSLHGAVVAEGAA